MEAAVKIHQAMMEYKDISAEDHRFGGTEYKLGKRELGHIHGNYLVDIPSPIKGRNEIIKISFIQSFNFIIYITATLALLGSLIALGTVKKGSLSR